MIGILLEQDAQIRNAVRRQARIARREILATLRTTDNALKILREDRELHLTSARAGVRLLLLCDMALLTDLEIFRELRLRVEGGVRVRVAHEVTSWMTVFDETVAVVPSSDRVTRGALLIDQPAVVGALRRVYSGLWSKALELPNSHAASRTSYRDRLLLEFMRKGVTDEAGARELKVSLRTYRRHLSEVMSRLGARSRFEAGVLAAESGLI